MRISKRLLVGAVAMLLVAGALTFALAARGQSGRSHDDSSAQLRTSLAPSQPTDPTFHGVTPGGAPWSLSEGRARLDSSGRFNLEVEGLVLTALGTPGPVTGIAASVFCGADANTVPAATTDAVPLSAQGDAEIEARLTLPSTCLVPVVLVNPQIGTTVIRSRYIAIGGFRA